MQENPRLYFSIAELARRWSVSHNTARKVAEEELGLMRVAGTLRVSIEAVKRKEEQSEVGA